MANIRKQFNFRNGVQIDDDNLVVSPLGLVGIGTTIPTEILDVRGTAKVVGLVTANEIYTQNLTALKLTSSSVVLGESIVGGGISVVSGIITSSIISGIVTYYGDGRYLQGLPTSQWVDVDVGLGFTSIYSRGYVGVGTIDPRFVFQVAGTSDTSLVGFTSGVGISSEGNILATGIVTAYKFSGIGSNIVQLNASNIQYGTINNDRLPVLLNSKLPSDVNISGIVTSQGGFSGNLTGNINSSGVSTFTTLKVGSDVTINSGIITTVTLVGNVTGIASTARSLTGNPDISVSKVIASSVNTGLSTAGISTVYNVFHVGTGGTFLSVTTDGKVGINSTLPDRDFELFKTGSASVEIVGSEDAEIIIGQKKTTFLGIGNSTATIRFGSNSKSFDLINNDSGDFNFYLHRAAPVVGVQTGRFAWIYGQTNSELMSLTYDGKLGIGKTNPQDDLHVDGTFNVTGNTSFGGDVTISGIITAGAFALGEFIIGSNIIVTNGISTFRSINVVDNLFINDFVGIGTSVPTAPLDARDKLSLFGAIGVNTEQAYVNNGLVVGGGIVAFQVGIGTTAIQESSAEIYGNVDIYPSDVTDAVFVKINRGDLILDQKSTIAVGKTQFPTSAVDFSEAGISIPGNIARQMIVPRVTTSERAGIRTERGAIVYDTTLNQLLGAIQVGTGNTQWNNLIGINTTIINTNQINVSGISTFAGITTVTGQTLFAKQLNVSGVTTSSSFVKQGGTSSQFLKADGSVDSNTYLTSYTESDTLTTVTNRGNSTSNGISVGVVTATRLEVGTGVTVSSGIVTAMNGFLSGIGTAVKITTIGNQLIFTVPGVGTTSLTLF